MQTEIDQAVKSAKAAAIVQLHNDVGLRKQALSMALSAPGNLSPDDVIQTSEMFVSYIAGKVEEVPA